MSERIFAPLVPPSISDERGLAFGAIMERTLNDPDFKKLLFERIDGADASALPFLIREFSIEEFCEPGMSAAVIRRLLKTAYAIHARKGFIDGVGLALEMLGVRVKWTQWFQDNPKGAPGTHKAVLYVRQTMFNGQNTLIDARIQRTALRFIDNMKRWSQDVGFELAVETASAFGAILRGATAGFLPVIETARPNPPDRLAAKSGAVLHGVMASFLSLATQARPLRKPLAHFIGVKCLGAPMQISTFRTQANASVKQPSFFGASLLGAPLSFIRARMEAQRP